MKKMVTTKAIDNHAVFNTIFLTHIYTLQQQQTELKLSSKHIHIHSDKGVGAANSSC